ncbi:MAG: ParB/RepB/Spo0J family partition protein [Pseudomonadales bacterium]|nr:ParB/RepB/Spo0J family partition protein [Pseudomonadales bacterium]MBL6813916.1 ParB/RepB/Spo0J family partition protein [Pseudomonadales bacterium]
MSKSRLGKGLDALLSTTIQTPRQNQNPESAAEQRRQSPTPASGLLEVAVAEITPSPYQPRRNFDEAALAELAASIAAQGVLQPLVVRNKAQGGYELIAGERRWRAAQQAGLQMVPVVLKQVSDQEASTIALVENIQREDLGAMEQASGLERLRSEFDLTQQELADVVGKSRVAVANSLRLLKLGSTARGLLERGSIDVGHAKAILALSGPEQDSAAQRIYDAGLSVREAEKMVRTLLDGAKSPAKEQRPTDPDVQVLQRRLMDHLGASVQIRQRRNGAGELVVKYTSLEELDGVLRRVKLPE